MADEETMENTPTETTTQDEEGTMEEKIGRAHV